MLAAPPTKQNTHAQFFSHTSSDCSGLLSVRGCRSGYSVDALEGVERLYKIFFPKAEQANSTAKSAVRLRSSITGFTSTISKLSNRP